MAALVLNNNPNARYDNGPNCAGGNLCSTQEKLQDGTPSRLGLRSDGVLWSSVAPRVGFSAAGVPRNNGGPNVAGAQKSINGT